MNKIAKILGGGGNSLEFSLYERTHRLVAGNTAEGGAVCR